MSNTQPNPSGSEVQPAHAGPTAASTAAMPAAVQDNTVRSHHSIRVGGKTLKYTATCGTVVLREESEKDGNRDGHKPRASMFFIAYTLDAAQGLGEIDAKRPISFAFNGGPGSSSVWLHLGVLGPKRVETDDFGNTPPPPYALVDNPQTLLAQSDLVFIDPVGTGFSRMLDGGKVSEFHDYQRDLDSVGEFIRQHLSTHHRWASPKYIIGESYGTTRAAGLAAQLHERYQIQLNGLMLISCALDFGSLRFHPGHDLPYQLFLPSYTATAWHHGKLPKALQKMSLREVVARSEAFAKGAYAQLLFAGSRLSAKQLGEGALALAELTGLSPDYLVRAQLRVSAQRFFKELLRGEGFVVGRLDSRFKAQDRDDAGELFEADAAHTNLDGAYSAHINHYLRSELGFESDLRYTLSSGLYLTWKWPGFEGRFPHVGEALRRAMHVNPHLRVYVASGYFDLATPHFATDYTLDHAITRPEMHKRINTQYFEAGHMMYIHQPDLRKLSADLAAFVTPVATAQCCDGAAGGNTTKREDTT